MHRYFLAPAEIFLVVCLSSAGAALADPAVPTAPTTAPSALTLNQTLDSFHPTPKQTIALRDFLGARGSDKIVPLGVQADGLTYFDLRNAANLRTGQIVVGQDTAEGSIFVAKLTGPAAYDTSHRAQVPRVLNAKIRGAVSTLLASAEAGAHFEAVTAKNRDMFLRDRPMLAFLPQAVTYPDRIVEMEASFFADGSGFYRAIRAPVGVSNPAMASIRLSAKFYPSLDADGQKAFRTTVLGIDADFSGTLADFGDKTPCPVAGCPQMQAGTPPLALKGEVHLTRWPHAVVPSAPANLIAQISPPPPPLPDILGNGTNPGAIDATGGAQPHTN